MRILFIRHGDPDYEHDTLTEKGCREAECLAAQAKYMDMGDCYVSPLGRAQKTAEYSMKALGKTAQTLDWLQEFPARVDLNSLPELQAAYPTAKKEDGKFIPRIVWDMVPSYLALHEEYTDTHRWRDSLACRKSDVLKLYDNVAENFDRLLSKYGYVREGRCYRVEKESTQTITFFCHFGITCVLLSHLWNISPFVLWHSTIMTPTSVTELISEEREKGIAYFRAQRIGDISHLCIAGEEPAFAGRFCEVWSDKEKRH